MPKTTWSVQIDEAGYDQVQKLAVQLSLTQAGAASLLVRAATPDRIRELVTEALGRLGTTTAPKLAPVGGGAPAPPSQDSAGR